MDSAHMVGHPIRFEARYPERFDQEQVERIDLHMSRRTNELGMAVASGDCSSPLTWTTYEPGVHVARLCLTDSRGGTTLSRPLYLFMQGRNDHMSRVAARKAWLLSGDLLKEYAACEDEAKRAFAANGDLAAYERMIVAHREVAKSLFAFGNEFVQDAGRLIDRNPQTGMVIRNDLFCTPRVLVVDLSEARRICRLDIVRGQTTNPLEQFAFDIKASNDPEAVYDYTNGLHTWQDGLRIVGSTRHHLVTPTPPSGRFSIYFPETEARFFQICIRELNPKEIRQIEFFERQEFVSNMDAMEFQIR